MARRRASKLEDDRDQVEHEFKFFKDQGLLVNLGSRPQNIFSRAPAIDRQLPSPMTSGSRQDLGPVKFPDRIVALMRTYNEWLGAPGRFEAKGESVEEIMTIKLEFDTLIFRRSIRCRFRPESGPEPQNKHIRSTRRLFSSYFLKKLS